MSPVHQPSWLGFKLYIRRMWLSLATIVCVVGLLPGTLSAQGQQRGSPFQPGKLTDPAGTPRDYRSQWFFLHTDLSGKEAKDLLDRLEKMLALVSRYWGKPPQKMIETYVIKDLKNWPPGSLDRDGAASVAAGGGVTQSRGFVVGGPNGAPPDPTKPRKLSDVTAVCYCGADRGTPQHEAVHAYCAQTFGTTGPVWYSEGMAEMGQYWRDGENRDVQIHAGVVDYLKNESIKSLNGIVNNRESTGDSWQNYAWRWALCHLLATNPNYAKRFRPLGLDLLTAQNLTFEQTYGDQADQISFEYRFFIGHICNGFRCDLAYFDWSKKFLPMSTTTARTVQVLADRGWQPTQASVTTDKSYEFSTTGSWQISKDSGNLGAAGNSDGHGKLVGVILKDYELGEPFDLGASGDFSPPSNGNLWVRCLDGWDQLGDNKGKVTLTLKLKK